MLVAGGSVRAAETASPPAAALGDGFAPRAGSRRRRSSSRSNSSVGSEDGASRDPLASSAANFRALMGMLRHDGRPGERRRLPGEDEEGYSAVFGGDLTGGGGDEEEEEEEEATGSAPTAAAAATPLSLRGRAARLSGGEALFASIAELLADVQDGSVPPPTPPAAGRPAPAAASRDGGHVNGEGGLAAPVLLRDGREQAVLQEVGGRLQLVAGTPAKLVECLASTHVRGVLLQVRRAWEGGGVGPSAVVL